MRYIFLSLVLLVFACNLEKGDHIQTNNSNLDHWGYKGENAPDNWANLSPEFIKCAEGHFQSPIDLESYNAKKKQGAILTFDYHPSPIDIVNNGHTVQAVVEDQDEFMIVDDHRYLLKQVHFHAPAEHQVDGIIYPMEMHMVHADSQGKLAVVGVLVKEGIEHQDLKAIMEHLPEHVDEHIHPKGSCDLLHLLPEEHSVFHYIGSLTTPPCSEGVEWFVMEKPIELSKKQIQYFKHLYDGNNRPIQAKEEAVIEIFE